MAKFNLQDGIIEGVCNSGWKDKRFINIAVKMYSCLDIKYIGNDLVKRYVRAEYHAIDKSKVEYWKFVPVAKA